MELRDAEQNKKHDTVLRTTATSDTNLEVGRHDPDRDAILNWIPPWIQLEAVALRQC